MLGNSKYSKVLTIMLIIVIIAVLIGIGFLTYNFIKGYKNDKENEEVMEAFTSSIKKREEEDAVNDNKQDGSITEGTETPMIGGGSTQSSGGSKKVTPISYNTASVIGIIEIPKINIKYPIYSEVTVDTLNKAVAKQYGVELNEVGNTVIAGHNYRNGKFFSNNTKLANGDKIYVTDGEGNKITYTIYNTYYTTPEDAGYFVRETNGKREISLTTCSDDSKQRLIIWAKED